MSEDPEGKRWRLVKALLEAAAGMDTGEREQFLISSCGEDTALREEVESLLRIDSEPTDEAVRDAIADSALRLSAPSPMEGTRIGHYRVLELIGEGGMGAVYLAVRDDDVYQRQVAIKVLHTGAMSPQVSARFLQERRILARLEHPNIARLYDGGDTAGGLPYFVMEHVSGKPVTAHCDEQRLPLRERLRLFLTVCGAVRYAHQNLVVHRDLKPQNILVTGGGEVKLLDFGIAKILEQEPETSLTTPLLRLLTPDYASPEQVTGAAVTTAADIYSLGAVLYRLLCGAPPHRFQSQTPSDLERVICEVEPPRLSAAATTPALARQLRGDLETIVQTAMRKEASLRYGSVEQLAGDIERYLGGLPIVARQAGLLYRAGKFARRNRWGLAAAVLIAVSLVGGILAASYEARRAERRFQQVRRLANTFLFEVHDEIQGLAGAVPAREKLVNTALEYLDSLAAEASGDQSLTAELASAYERVGDVQGYPYRPNLGKTQEALSSYRKALAFSEQLAAGRGRTAVSRAALASRHYKMGTLLLYSGASQEAAAEYERGLGIAEAAGDTPLLLTGHSHLGQLWLTQGNPEQSLGHYAKALRLCDNSGAQSVLRAAVAAGHLADAQMQAGLIEEALVHYRKFLKAFEAGTTAEDKRMLMLAHRNLGNVFGNPYYLNLGSYEEAEAHFRQSLLMARQIAAADEKSARAVGDLGGAYWNLGAVLEGRRPAEAAEAYRQAIAITESMVRRSPRNTDVLRLHAFNLIGLGRALGGQRKVIAAEEQLRTAVEILEGASKADRVRTQLLHDVVVARLSWGHVRAQAGDAAGSRPHFAEAARIGEGFSKAHATDLSCQRYLAESYEGLARSWRNEDCCEAARWSRKSLHVWQQYESRIPYAQRRLRQAAVSAISCPSCLP
ncbi:MAG: serine/threonine protein kinase [Acidobacteria bacterium]|nr:serine/threonine protein kinase [Acidobacteriota bacterium]